MPKSLKTLDYSLHCWHWQGKKHPSLFCRRFDHVKEGKKFCNIEFCSLVCKVFILVVDANAIYKPYTTHSIAGIGKEKHTSLFGHDEEDL
jgi:hypothetical protein